MSKIINKKYLICLAGIIALIFSIVLVNNVSYAAELSDIEGHWAESDIKFMEAKGAISGYPDGTFRPNNNVTVAEAMKLMIANFDKEIKNGEEYWASTYFDYAEENGIVDLYQYKLNGLDKNITRKEVMYMVINSLESLACKPIIENNDAKIKFYDTGITVNEDGIDYYSAIKKCYFLGIVMGDDKGNMNPNSNITRAELIAILTRAYNEGRRQYDLSYREVTKYRDIYSNMLMIMPNSFYEAGINTFAKYKTNGAPSYYTGELFYNYTQEGLKDSKLIMERAVSALFNVSYDMTEEEWANWEKNICEFTDVASKVYYEGKYEKLREYEQYVIDNKITIKGGAIIDPLTFGNMKGIDGKYKLSVKGIIRYNIISNPNNVKKLTYTDYTTNKTSIYGKNYNYILLELIDQKDVYQMNNMKFNSTSVVYVEN